MNPLSTSWNLLWFPEESFASPHVPPNDCIAGEYDEAGDREGNTIVHLVARAIPLQLNVVTFSIAAVVAKCTYTLGMV